MAKEQYAELMREFTYALEAKDMEKILSFCTEDIRFVTPFGTFEGKGEVSDLLEWMSGNIQSVKYTETGTGIIVQGDKAAYEHTLTGKYEGEEIEVDDMHIPVQ
ncbi:MAG: nuclear transport factor 2 family protein [Candidatus Saliniplasma sp.]